MAEIGKQTLGDIAGGIWGSYSHNVMASEYGALSALTRQERLDIDTAFEKINSPLMIDIGVGNVQVYTAIRLLNDYISGNPNSDPLGLKKYENDFPSLVDDLLDKLSPTSTKIAGLMVKEAFEFGQSSIQNWAILSDEQKEGFAVYYYNVGQDFIIETNSDLIIAGTYTVDIPNTPIAQEYLENKDNIVAASDPANPFWQGTATLIAQDYYSQECFPAFTSITLADGSSKPISDIRIGDEVLSFDENGNLLAGIVDKLFRNTTSEFIKLTFTDGRDDLVATPGHRFLTETGDFMEIGHMVRLGGRDVRLVEKDGSIVSARGEVLVHNAETAELFEQVEFKRAA